MTTSALKDVKKIDDELLNLIGTGDLMRVSDKMSRLINERKQLTQTPIPVEEPEESKENSKQSYKDTIRMVEAVVREFKACIQENCPDEAAREILLRDALNRVEKVLMGTSPRKARKV